MYSLDNARAMISYFQQSHIDSDPVHVLLSKTKFNLDVVALVYMAEIDTFFKNVHLFYADQIQSDFKWSFSHSSDWIVDELLSGIQVTVIPENETDIQTDGNKRKRDDSMDFITSEPNEIFMKEDNSPNINYADAMEYEDDAFNNTKVHRSGGVYFAWSDCLNCMKIGATRRETPFERLRELSRYVTSPFKLAAWIPTPTPFRLESQMHAHFSTKRIRSAGAGTEFFHVSVAEATAFVTTFQQRS